VAWQQSIVCLHAHVHLLASADERVRQATQLGSHEAVSVCTADFAYRGKHKD